MASRFLLGLLKGLFVGATVALVSSYGARLPMPSGTLFAYVLAMGVGGTTGVFAGRAPWREKAWLEALLKGLVGVGVGALLYWLAFRYVNLGVPLGLVRGLAMPAFEAGLPERVSLIEIPLLLLPLVGAAYGALVELDHAGPSDDDTRRDTPRARKPSAKDTRLATASTVEDAELVDERPKNKKT